MQDRIFMNLIMQDQIEKTILTLRGQRVMLDADLARIYGVETKKFNQQIKRNLDRFQMDFMFRLTKIEAEPLRSQIVILRTGRGGRRYYKMMHKVLLFYFDLKFLWCRFFHFFWYV